MPDFLALIGDTADGIPGLTGFGEKGAGMLLGAYAHLEDIPAPRLPVDGQAARAPCSWPRRWPRTCPKRCSTASWPPWSTDAPVSATLEEMRFLGRAPAAVRGLVRGAGREHPARRSAPLGSRSLTLIRADWASMPVRVTPWTAGIA